MNDETIDDFYTQNRDWYILQAYEKAFGQKDDSWDPSLGFAANRDRIVTLYGYYRDTYLARPGQFLWAGLGRLAGGAVVGGLDFAIRFQSDPSFLTTTMVRIGKNIFLDLVWLHEAFLDDPSKAVRLAQEHDTRHPAKRSYAEAWTKISNGSADDIADGNRMLLENEQFTIIQPLYDAIKGDPESLGTFQKTSAFTSNIHPYHRDFITAFPMGDVTVDTDRWAWIAETDGMWEKWVAMPQAERVRLINLSMDDLIAQRWGPTIDSLLPPGSQ